MEMSSLKISDYIKNYCAHDLGNCKYFEFVYEILHAEGDGFFTRAQKFIYVLLCVLSVLHEFYMLWGWKDFSSIFVY